MSQISSRYWILRNCFSRSSLFNYRMHLRRKIEFSRILTPSYSTDSGNESSGPLTPYPRIVDKYMVPATVMTTGAFLSPGLLPMLTKPIHLWFYRTYYDVQFDMNEFLIGARRALYFVAEKAFTKDFFGLIDVLTPEAMEQIREMTKDDSFRFYLNLHSPTTPILYERIGAARFVDIIGNMNENESIQYYPQNNVTPSVTENRFEILVFFVCKIERLLAGDASRNDDGQKRALESGVKNYTRLLIMMTFSRLLERKRHQTSDWLVSSLALMPIQYTFKDKVD